MQLLGVGKRYGLRQPWVVREVTAGVAAGQLTRVQGSNGSGKSTLLRIAAGVTAPTAGRVSGRPRAGYVPERFPAALAFSARDYLHHLARIHGLTASAGRAAAEQWLERLGAAGYAAAPLRTLSKGMCQKVAVAQALLARPALLVLDEAWTGLDQAARDALDAAVTERLADGAAVLFVDHDPARLAGRVDQRWQLAGARLSVSAGPGEPPPQAGETTVVVDVTGLDDAAAARLSSVPAVLAGPDGPAAGPRQLVVAAGESDAVLRVLLGLDGVHVAGVRPGPAGRP